MTLELKHGDLKRDVFGDVARISEKAGEVSLYMSKYALIGQERAETSLKLGLSIKRRDYNIFVSGPKGAGKTTFASFYAKKTAEGEPIPNDICFVYNFREPKCPVQLNFKPGDGTRFRDDMDELIQVVKKQFCDAFESRVFEDEKAGIMKRYQNARDEVILRMNEEAKSRDFGVKVTNTGIYFMPIVNGEPLSEEQFEALSEEEKRKLNAKSDEIQAQASGVMYEIKEYEALTKKDIDNLEYRTALLAVGKCFSDLFDKYSHMPDVTDYLVLVKEDVLANYGVFLDDETSEEAAAAVQNILPWIARRANDNPLSKYMVNLFVDSSKLLNAPVVISYNPTYANLMGELEFDSEYGSLSTDFMKIKAGLLHQASGGYLILQEEDVLSNGFIWDTLKKVARTGEAVIEPSREFSTGIAISSVKPKPIAVNVKFIIIGSHYVYSVLSEVDADFRKFFKVNAVFGEEMTYNDENLGGILAFIKAFIKQEKMPEFDLGALSVVVGHFVRLSENKDKLTARFNLIQNLLIESGYWAAQENAAAVEKRHVTKALAEAERRNNMYEEKINELIDNNIIMLDTASRKIGQINGLCVISTENHCFGKPAKITATTYVGKAGVINIEKEAEMSGAVHNKGIEVISGYLGQTYAQDFPLSLSCRVCFEQNYGGIDGDSASSTELYAVISSLSGLHISQEIAVTGSVNQRGEIQAIGGVTAKIEGFYDLCEKRGFTGSQGVIIPFQNVADLCLKDEVIESVKDGVFHIYAITHIDEGLEILTGVKAGERNARGTYPAESIHGRVLKKLKSFHEKSLEG